MPFTPFAIFLIAIYIYAALRDNHVNFLVFALSITVIVTLNVRMGYFFRIGTFEMNYSSVLSYILGLLSLILVIRNRGNVKARDLLTCALFFHLLMAGYVALVFFPYPKAIITGGWYDFILTGQANFSFINSSSVKVGYYLMFICYGITMLALKTNMNCDSWIKVLKNVVRISRISVVIGYVEWLFVNFFHTKIITNICIAIFGSSGAQQNLLTRRGFLYTIQGITKEPSMYATTVFYFIVLLMVEIFISPERKKKKWFIFACILLLINPTMSSYLYIFLIVVFVITLGLLKENKQRFSKSFIIFTSFETISVIIMVILWSNYQFFIQSSYYIIKRVGITFQQLNILLDGAKYGSYSSEGIRFTGIVYDLRLIKERPLLGFGLGSLSCNSGIITLLVNLGILGFVAWFMMMMVFCTINTRNKSELLFVLLILILPNIILNDYETILCLAIPLACICYSYNISKSSSTLSAGRVDI